MCLIQPAGQMLPTWEWTRGLRLQSRCSVHSQNSRGSCSTGFQWALVDLVCKWPGFILIGRLKWILQTNMAWRLRPARSFVWLTAAARREPDGKEKNELALHSQHSPISLSYSHPLLQCLLPSAFSPCVFVSFVWAFEVFVFESSQLI